MRILYTKDVNTTMISFTGFDKTINNVYKFNQDHVFQYWSDLTDEGKTTLLKELSMVDFELMNKLYHQREIKIAYNLEFDPAPYIPLPKSKRDIEEFEKAREAGIKYIGKGKVAALLVSGGQGTRLGFHGPKGLYPIGPVSDKSLLRIHAEKILKYSEKYGVSIPWCIMTSLDNHDDTVRYFDENRFFNLNKGDVIFFSQKMIPSLNSEGKLILKSKNSIFMNPDGHGGTLTALHASGVLDDLDGRGIESISYFQVDNPMMRIIDPVFIGFHIINNSDVSSKAVRKLTSTEKVGVFVKFNNGKLGVVEYSDLSLDKQNAIDDDGGLKFCMGSIAIHIFNISFVKAITSGKTISLDYHLAKKKIEAYQMEGNVEIDGFKFEKFIFDSLTLTEKNTILETLREDEFAPVKNKSGVDSPETAKELMSNLFRRWLTSKSCEIPDETKMIEISPLLAVEPDDLHDNITIPPEEKVYLE